MTGFYSKRRIALDRLDDDDIQVYAQSDLKGKEHMKEALKLALEALEGSIALTMAKIALRNKAITAIKEALAQPVQGPVAIHQFRSPHCSDWYDGIPDHHDGHGPYEVRTLYTAPPAQPAPVRFKCTVIDEQHPNGIPLELWGNTTPPAAQPVQEPTLQEQLDKANADWDKADADLRKANAKLNKAKADKNKASDEWHNADTDLNKANANRNKADADLTKANAEIARIEKLIEEKNNG